MKQECIYVATRLTAPHPIEYLVNLKQSLKAGAEIWRKGHIPFIPGLDVLTYMELDGEYGLGGRLPYNAGLEWVRRCDAILIYNGLEDSPGVQAEYKVAMDEGKKVYWSLNEILPYGDNCPTCKGSGKLQDPVHDWVVIDCFDCDGLGVKKK